ncbi:hypothetical protein BZG36_00276 [Bifiguratus adelaidae]|uniref:Uncharacterized protein n=1 Tax=Bifiguratus adelaidae TaxID=1938954 RepID=A0A261Y7N5_9FUNG|nr:hypothetical protein BZG36_00276 [Bifiguratus adelaidae]
MQNAQKKKYPFPTCKADEILRCMYDLQIPFSEEDLNKPSAERILRIYASIAAFFTGVSPTELEEQSRQVLADLEYPETQRESVLQMAVHRQMVKLMVAAGMDDFSLRDLIKPDARRVKIVLSGVINFAKFREERMGIMEQFTHQMEDNLEQLSNVEEEYGRLKAQIQELRNQREIEIPQIQDAEKRNEQRTLELKKLKSDQEQLVAKYENAKARKEDLRRQLDSKSTTKKSLLDEIARLQSRVVQNPEELQKLVAETQIALQAEKQSLEAEEKKAREVNKRLGNFELVEQDVLGLHRMVDEALTSLQNYETEDKRNRRLQEDIDQQRRKLKELDVKDQQIKRRYNNVQDKVARQSQQQDVKRQSYLDDIADLRAQHEAMAQEHAYIEEQVIANKKKADETEQKAGYLLADPIVMY